MTATMTTAGLRELLGGPLEAGSNPVLRTVRGSPPRKPSNRARRSLAESGGYIEAEPCPPAAAGIEQ